MKKYFKKVVALVLAFVMVFGFAACGGGGNGGDDDGQAVQDAQVYKRSNMGNKVKSPNEIYYLVENPIEITTINAFPNGEPKPEGYPTAWEYSEMSDENKAQYDKNEARFDGSYIQISGLKDKDIEAKVNAKLKEHFVEYAAYIPPYRGIKVLIGEDPQIPDSKYYYPSANMYSYGNLNNILCVALNGYKQFLDADGEISEWGEPVQHYISYIEPITIDLNTGEEIPLESLFCDDIDPYAYLNDKVKAELRSGNADEEGWFAGTNLRLSGQFTGIKPDQKYMVGSSGISLVFDYDTPEVSGDGMSYSATVVVPYEDVCAVTARFYDPDENIYEEEKEPIKMFPYQYSQKQEPIIREDYQIDSTWVYLNATVYESTPQVLKDQIADFMTMTDDEVTAALSPAFEEALLMHDPANKVESNYSRNASTNIFGPFVNVHKSENKYIAEYGNAPSKQYMQEYREWNEVYDMRTLDDNNPVPLEITDFFHEGVDYEKAVKEAIAESIKRNIAYENPDEDTAAVIESNHLFESYVDALYDDIIGFSVNSKYLVLTFDDANAVFCEVYGVKSTDEIAYGWRYVYGAQELTYESLGYDNLTIFDR